MLKKSILLVCLLSLGLFFGTACQSQEKGEAEVLRVGVLSIDDSLPIALADEEDRYAAAGLEVQVFPFKSSSDQSQALEAGELDVVMNDMIVQGLMKKGGTDTKILSYAFGATPQEGRFMVLASPQSDLETPQDLIGAKVAISTNTMMEFLMDAYADHFGLAPQSIEYVNMPNLILRLETLLEGQDIQAAILPDPLASFAASQGAKVLIDDTTLDRNFSQSVILARQEVIEQQPQALQTFLDVTFAMMEDINENPDSYRAFAQDFAKVPEGLKDTYPMPTYTPGALPSEAQVAQVTSWLQAKGLIPEAYSYEDMVAEDFAYAA